MGNVTCSTSGPFVLGIALHLQQQLPRHCMALYSASQGDVCFAESLQKGGRTVPTNVFT